MADYTFKVDLSGITKLECFKEASKDELKILIALASLGDESISTEALAKELGVSKARVMATLTLFEESGLITKSDNEFLAEIEYEFEPKKNEKPTANSKGAANDLENMRDKDIREITVEMERLLEKTLEIREIERIISLYTEKGLSIAYILDLAAYLKDTRQRLTVESIVREANRLIEKNKTTLEELELYIKEKSEEVAGEREMRNLFGIYNRTLTKSEREFFKKWMHEFAYSNSIIGEAYDITVNATGDRSLGYIDKILTTWHEAGCKTLEECRAKATMHRHTKGKHANNSSQKSKKSVEAETPKYTDFNSEDALMRALERSYGDSDGK